MRSVFVVVLLAVFANSAAAGLRTRSGNLRRLLSDRSTLATKRKAADALPRGALRKAVGAEVRAAERGAGFEATILPLGVVRALGQHGGADALPALLSQLRRRPVTEQYSSEEAAAALAIGQRTGRAAEVEAAVVEALANQIARRPDDAALAREVVHALDGARSRLAAARRGRAHPVRAADVPLNGPAVRQLLVGLLDHRAAKVRNAAARGLGDRGAVAEVVAALRGRGIRQHRRTEVRRTLLEHTIFVDRELSTAPEIRAELERFAAGRNPRLAAAAREVLAITRRLDRARPTGRPTLAPALLGQLAEIWKDS